MSVYLTAEEKQWINCPISEARGLPNRAYTSPAWAQEELVSTLGQQWFCIGFESDLPCGSVKPIFPLQLPLIMLRDSQGRVRVFHNVCRHRGHRLVAKAESVVGRLRCPYHHWTYALDGTLESTPHFGGPHHHQCAASDRTGVGLFPVRSAVWLGMVFINLSAKAPDLETFLAPVRERWGHFVGNSGFSQLGPDPEGAFDLDLSANWKLAVENYCESYHLPAVHPSLNRYSRLEDHYSIYGEDGFAGQGTTAFTYGERNQITMPCFPSWPKEEWSKAEYIALFPNVLLGLQRDHFYSVILEPLRCDLTRERTQLYFIGDAVTDPELAVARQALRDSWRGVFIEDISVVEGMQAGRESPAYDGGIFSPAMDVSTHWFHQWVASHCADRS